jgi:aminoglycoside phosphotransferase (APT) family kinase protein
LAADELDATTVVRILERQFPELAPVRAEYLGAGMDSVAFEVNERWVFRFPLREPVERQLFVERAMLPVIAPLVRLRIPSFAFNGSPDADCAFHFSGYEKLPGIQATAIDVSRVSFDTIAAQLGPFLSTLHRFPIDEAARLGAETIRLEDFFDEVRRSALVLLPGVSDSLERETVRRVERYLERLQALAVPPWPLTLAHNDLAADHILVDATGARITAVIDWGDVAIADPTVDFVGLFVWGGEPLVRQVLASYDGPVNESVLQRVSPWAAMRSIQDIRFGLDNDLPDIVRLGVRALERELDAD